MHPFVCLACGKGFKYEHSLNFHIKSYHGSGNSNGSNVASSPSISSITASSSNNNDTSMTGKVRSRSVTSSTSSPPSPPASSINNNLKYSSVLRVKNERDCQESPSFEDRLVIQDNMESEYLSKERGMTTPRVRYERTTSVEGCHVHENTSEVSDLTLVARNSERVSLPSSTGNEGMSSSSSESSSQQDFGFPAKVSSKGIQIKSEKALISIMEGIHSQSDQTYLLYKCCLCGYAFPSLEPILSHMQSMHSNQNSLTCDKCGASFRWKSELQLHEQLHRAMDQPLQSQSHSPEPQQGHHTMVFPSTTDSSKSKALSSPSSINNNNSNSIKSPSLQSLSLQNSLHNLVMFPHPFLSGEKNFSMESLVNPDNMSILSNLMQQHNNTSDMKNLQDNGKSMSVRGKGSHVNDSRTTRQRDTFPEQVLNLSRNHVANDKQQPLHHQHQDLLRENSLKRSSHEVIDYRTNTGGRSSSSPSTNTERPVKMMKQQHSNLLSSQQDMLMISKANPPPSGEIEEIAPGQFKCRYCDKTFDRVFSVHRHERVHTGFKPCICKVCGRGFSEKRNLRHHIIRFHSDGSGRELLKRARKDKALAASAKHLAASVMIGDHAFPLDVRVPLNNNHHNHSNQLHHTERLTPQSDHLPRSLSSSRHQKGSSSSSGCFSPSFTNDHKREEDRRQMEVRERDESNNNRDWRQEEESEDEESLVIATPDHHLTNNGSDSCEPRPVVHVNNKSGEEQLSSVERDDDSQRQQQEQHHESLSPPSTSSSRRRKGKPSKKIFVNNEDEDDEGSHRERLDDEDEGVQHRHHDTKRSDMRDEEDDWEEDDNRHHHQEYDSKKSTENRDEGEDFANEEEMSEDGVVEVITADRPVSRSKSDGNFSESDSNSNGGNHSENSLEINLNSGDRRNRGHGAFFSSYSPR